MSEDKLKRYREYCHKCGKKLVGDITKILKCSDDKCLFRLLQGRIPFEEKKAKKDCGCGKKK